MTRTTGATNFTDYRYKVEANGGSQYFISQIAIQEHYDLKRTAVYFLINAPERRKDKRGLRISKLEPHLPVYRKIKEEDEFGGYILKCEKIIY